jgi:hypothetical protein
MRMTLTRQEADALDSLRLARMKLGWAVDEAEGEERHRLRSLWMRLDNVIKELEA